MERLGILIGKFFELREVILGHLTELPLGHVIQSLEQRIKIRTCLLPQLDILFLQRHHQLLRHFALLLDALYRHHEFVDSLLQRGDAVVLAAVQQLDTFLEQAVTKRTLALVELYELVGVLEAVFAYLALDFHRA